MPLPRAQFRRCCRRLDRAALAAFIAGLEAARGRSVEHRGDGRIRVRMPEGSRLLVVASPGRGRHSEADEVIVHGDPAGPRTVGPDELHRRLCYAVDREDARRLVRTHLNCDPGAFDPPGGPTGARSGRTGIEAGTAQGLLAAVAVASLLLVCAGAAAFVGGPSGGATPGAGGSTPVQPVAVGSAEPDRVTPVAAPEAAVATDSAVNYPPGLSADGIADYERLVRTNRRALADRSYTLSITYREFVNGSQTASYAERLAVADATHYRGVTSETGAFERPPMRIAGADQYADGSRRYTRTTDGVRAVSVRGSEPYLPTLSRYLAWHLSVNESAVEREGDRYRVYFADDPYPTVDNATGVAVVGEDGVIRSLERRYDRPFSPVRVELTIEVERVGETTIGRPDWVG